MPECSQTFDMMSNIRIEPSRLLVIRGRRSGNKCVDGILYKDIPLRSAKFLAEVLMITIRIYTP